MAIQPHHLNYFPSHITPNNTNNRDMINMEFKPDNNIYNLPMDFGLPLSATTTDSTLPCFNSSVVWVPPQTAAAESGITSGTYRKRSLDSFPMTNNIYAPPHKVARNNNDNSVSFLGEDITLQLQQQQLETDRLIAQHMEKVRLLMLQRCREHSKRAVAALKEAILRKLKEKEEEIERTLKLNWLLEERANALFLESQMWRNLAESHEATSNALRNNLEELLANNQFIKEEEVADDAESCCGSSNQGGGQDVSSGSRLRLCRKCANEESSVVLMPCKHLCACVSCATNLQKCPVCDARNEWTVHVNMQE